MYSCAEEDVINKTKQKEIKMKVKFISFAKQKRITDSINPNAVFQVTAQDGEWLTLDGRYEVHVSEVRPVKGA